MKEPKNINQLSSAPNIIDYIRVEKDFMPFPLMDKWKEVALNGNWEKHQWAIAGSTPNLDYKGSKPNDPSVIRQENIDLDPALMQSTLDLFKKSMNINYPDWRPRDIKLYHIIKSIGNLRLKRYETGQSLNQHIDHITTMFDGTRRGIPILSGIMLLDFEFEGGDFHFYNHNYTVDIGPGDLLMFPSAFMYGHEVFPVTSGTRYSLNVWGY